VPELVLASTSAYRRALLARLGLPFRCRAPVVDEDTLKNAGLAPRELAERLARAKAQSLAASEPGAVLLGGDQVVAFGGRAFGKPGDEARAVDQLLAMAGAPHELITSIAVLHPGGLVEHTDVTTLWMRPLTRSEAVRYVRADRPTDCAGAYKLEERGITLFHRVDSADHTAVTGLPLIALTTILRGLGFVVP
jgi:septum formation protein